MQSIFWIGLFIIFYTYLGYAILLFVIVKILRLFRSKNGLRKEALLKKRIY